MASDFMVGPPLSRFSRSAGGGSIGCVPEEGTQPSVERLFFRVPSNPLGGPVLAEILGEDLREIPCVFDFLQTIAFGVR